jgi:hypothetical protein
MPCRKGAGGITAPTIRCRSRICSRAPLVAERAPALVRIIRPIVRGQLRSFIADHPGALEKRWVASIEKRITNDLLSRGSALRLGAALCLADRAAPPDDALAQTTEASPAGVGTKHCAGRPSLEPGDG